MKIAREGNIYVITPIEKWKNKVDKHCLVYAFVKAGGVGYRIVILKKPDDWWTEEWRPLRECSIWRNVHRREWRMAHPSCVSLGVMRTQQITDMNIEISNTKKYVHGFVGNLTNSFKSFDV